MENRPQAISNDWKNQPPISVHLCVLCGSSNPDVCTHHRGQEQARIPADFVIRLIRSNLVRGSGQDDSDSDSDTETDGGEGSLHLTDQRVESTQAVLPTEGPNFLQINAWISGQEFDDVGL